MKATVKVENLKIYAFHGCMEEEKVIGSDYIVNIEADCFVGNDAFNDKISEFESLRRPFLFLLVRLPSHKVVESCQMNR